jgi:hypothetical protein
METFTRVIIKGENNYMKERSKVKEGREGMCFDCPGI